MWGLYLRQGHDLTGRGLGLAGVGSRLVRQAASVLHTVIIPESDGSCDVRDCHPRDVLQFYCPKPAHRRLASAFPQISDLHRRFTAGCQSQ